MTRNQFIPESKRHGDRYPRTLEEAFGPGAQLDAEAPPILPGAVMIPLLIVGAFAAYYLYVFYVRFAP